MTARQQIEAILATMPKQAALDLINSIGKHMRQENSIRINSGVKLIIEERPDLIQLKEDE